MQNKLVYRLIAPFRAAGACRFVFIFIVLEALSLFLVQSSAIIFLGLIIDDVGAIDQIEDAIGWVLSKLYMGYLVRILTLQYPLQILLLISFRIFCKHHKFYAYLASVLISSLIGVTLAASLEGPVFGEKFWRALLDFIKLFYPSEKLGYFSPGFYMILSALPCWWVMQWLYRKSILQDKPCEKA